MADSFADQRLTVGGGIERRKAAPKQSFKLAAGGWQLFLVDLPRIQHVALRDPPVGDPAVLRRTAVTVRLADLLVRLRSQEHGGSVRPPLTEPEVTNLRSQKSWIFWFQFSVL